MTKMKRHQAALYPTKVGIIILLNEIAGKRYEADRNSSNNH